MIALKRFRCDVGFSFATVVWLYLWAQFEAAPDFSGYLLKILQNHTVHACDGDRFSISCPPQTSISILSAFYGRRVSSEHLCPSGLNTSAESINCAAVTAVPKLYDECQEQHSCQFSVNRRVFGPDPCPGTSKYLIVSFKCKPDGHQSNLVCENETLHLQCKNQTVLVIYTASYGRALYGNMECPSTNSSTPDIECLSPTTLRIVSSSCHSKANCSITASVLSFGDPCIPGIRKQLNVSYTCVPKKLFEEAGQGPVKPFLISDYTHGGWYNGPRMSMLYAKDVAIISSSLATLAHIRGLPEKVALFFLSGVCSGLVFILCTIGFHMLLRQDISKLQSEAEDNQESENGHIKISDDEDDGSSDISFRQLTRQYRASDNIFSPEMAAVIVDRGEQNDLRDREMWLNKEPSPYAIQNLNHHQ
ncbi:protein eva-1 homolog C-like isoform X1 [Amblyraja radiata]|uniref:protein eva-1 homolog C-like isoform X1 n=1 Tax=Amblyraja radiata TaxID=386614 RepID=UPI001401E15C|nr:protein eva-1 homolog C-like isoform X1 [Amblyraja radiata]